MTYVRGIEIPKTGDLIKSNFAAGYYRSVVLNVSDKRERITVMWLLHSNRVGNLTFEDMRDYQVL